MKITDYTKLEFLHDHFVCSQIISIVAFLMFSGKSKTPGSSSSSETSETNPLISDGGIREIIDSSTYGATNNA